MFFDLRTQLSIKLIDDTHVFSSPPAPRLQPFQLRLSGLDSAL